MSKSTEEVLLIVQAVKQKKTEGQLYMMSERMAWMPGSRGSFTISHNFTDIKSEFKFL